MHSKNILTINMTPIFPEGEQTSSLDEFNMCVLQEKAKNVFMRICLLVINLLLKYLPVFLYIVCIGIVIISLSMA